MVTHFKLHLLNLLPHLDNVLIHVLIIYVTFFYMALSILPFFVFLCPVSYLFFLFIYAAYIIFLCHHLFTSF